MLNKALLGCFLCICSLIPVVSFSQDDVPQENILEDEVETSCEIFVPQLLGWDVLVKDVSTEFKATIIEWKNIETHTFALYSGENKLTTFNWEIFAYNFSEPGEYRLAYEQIYDDECRYLATKNIRVFSKMITYIWTNSEEITLGRESMANDMTYIHEILIDDMSSVRGEQFTTLLVDQSYFIKYAHALLVDWEVVGPLFDRLSTLKQLAWLTLDVDLYVLSTMNQSAFRRMIATHRDVLWVDKMYVVWKQFVWSLLTSLLLEKDPSALNFVKTYIVWLESSNKLMVVSYLVDYLLYHDFPLGALLFILILPLLVLLISIFRQVIGLSVFGVFYPIFFSFSLHILWVWPTILFLSWAFLTTLIVGYFTKRIYLLYSAKVSLLVVFYCLITLCLLRLSHRFAIVPINYSLFQNYYFLFPFLMILLVGNRIFTEQFYLFDPGWWTGLLEFVIISLIIYWCISSPLIQNTVLGFPEISLISLFVIIIVWRFTWLQLLEYIRFMPLIKHYFEEEE